MFIDDDLKTIVLYRQGYYIQTYTYRKDSIT